jgi:hypothetical protein
VTAYRKGETSLTQFVEALPPDPSFKNLEKFRRALSMERSLELEEVQKERSDLLKNLGNRLNQNQLDEILQWSVAYRAGQLTHGQFYDRLRSACAAGGVALSQYPRMARYLEYVLLSESVDAQDLFQEMDRAEIQAYAGLARSDDEK